jgi:hypothetical protein
MRRKCARSKNSCAYVENGLNSLWGFRGLAGRQSIRFPLARKFPFLNIRIVVPNCLAYRLGERGVAANSKSASRCPSSFLSRSVLRIPALVPFSAPGNSRGGSKSLGPKKPPAMRSPAKPGRYCTSNFWFSICPSLESATKYIPAASPDVKIVD